MRTFDYALWTTSLVIDGLREGFTGYNIWTLQEINYPGHRRMVYGLWDYKDNNWKPRPVFYAWRNFCRHTETGDPVIPTSLTPFRRVKAARIGKTVFWVNENGNPKKVRVDSTTVKEGKAWDEATVEAGLLEGKSFECCEDTIVFPARSFGILSLQD